MLVTCVYTSMRANICYNLYLGLGGMFTCMNSPSRESLVSRGVAVLPWTPEYKTLLRRTQQQQTQDPRRDRRSSRSSQQMCTPRHALRQATGTRGKKAGRAGLGALGGPLQLHYWGPQALPAVRPTEASGPGERDRIKKKKRKSFYLTDTTSTQPWAVYVNTGKLHPLFWKSNATGTWT